MNVHHKPLYAAIRQIDNRHRKPMSTGRMIERLMVLDAVLDDATFTWLATEFDKRSYFIRVLKIGPFKIRLLSQLVQSIDRRQSTWLYPGRHSGDARCRDHPALGQSSAPDGVPTHQFEPAHWVAVDEAGPRLGL
jgi:hypothetical protein